VIASENSSPEAALVLKRRTESGQDFLPISEMGARQVQKVIGEFNRRRDFLFVEGRPAAEATLQ
jgi:hypothetical protein